MAPGMGRFFLNLPRTVKKCALGVGYGGVWNCDLRKKKVFFDFLI